jgi:hypothetical protein
MKVNLASKQTALKVYRLFHMSNKLVLGPFGVSYKIIINFLSVNTIVYIVPNKPNLVPNALSQMWDEYLDTCTLSIFMIIYLS